MLDLSRLGTVVGCLRSHSTRTGLLANKPKRYLYVITGTTLESGDIVLEGAAELVLLTRLLRPLLPKPHKLLLSYDPLPRLWVSTLPNAGRPQPLNQVRMIRKHHPFSISSNIHKQSTITSNLLLPILPSCKMHSSFITVAALAAGVLAAPAATTKAPSAIIATGKPIIPTIFPSKPLTALPLPSPLKGISLPSPISSGLAPVATLTSKTLGIIENAACYLDQNLAPLENLTPLFGVAEFLGEIIGPALNKTFGDDFITAVDQTADQLCVSAQQDDQDGLGICQTALGALFFLANHLDESGVQAYKCFLSLACVAPTGFDHPGTCQELLAGSDCIANRIIDEAAAECCPKSNPNCNSNPTNS
nr:hypothetical protein CFP56_52131 [Quercus suber]